MILIAIVAMAVFIVIICLLVVLFAFLNPWAVVAMVGMGLTFLYFFYGKKRSANKIARRR